MSASSLGNRVIEGTWDRTTTLGVVPLLCLVGGNIPTSTRLDALDQEIKARELA